MNTCCGEQNKYTVPPTSYYNLAGLPDTNKKCYCPCLSYYGHRSVRDVLDRYIYMEQKPDFFFKSHDSQECTYGCKK